MGAGGGVGGGARRRRAGERDRQGGRAVEEGWGAAKGRDRGSGERKAGGIERWGKTECFFGRAVPPCL